MTPPSRNTPTRIRAIKATQNRKCSAEITIEMTKKMASTASRIRIRRPMVLRYVTAATGGAARVTAAAALGRPVRRQVGRGHPLGHDHAPGVEDELGHLLAPDGAQPDQHPVVPEVRLARQQELAGLRGDQRVAFLFGKSEPHDRLVR